MRFFSLLAVSLLLSPLVAMAGDLGVGRALFQKKMCAACHGQQGEKSPQGASPLSQTKLAKAGIIEVITKGRGRMRAMNATTDEAATLADYVLSLKK